MSGAKDILSKTNKSVSLFYDKTFSNFWQIKHLAHDIATIYIVWLNEQRCGYMYYV